jgi:hypothetical protein
MLFWWAVYRFLLSLSMLLLQRASCINGVRHISVSHMLHFLDVVQPVWTHVTRRFRGGRFTETCMLKHFAAHTPYMNSGSQSFGYCGPHEVIRNTARRIAAHSRCQKVIAPFPGPRMTGDGFAQNMFRVYRRRCVSGGRRHCLDYRFQYVYFC